MFGCSTRDSLKRVFITLVVAMFSGSAAWAQFEDAKICKIRSNVAGVWDVSASSTSPTSNINNLNDSDLDNLTNWYSDGAPLAPAPDITTVTICNDDQSPFPFQEIEVRPETTGSLGFEQVTVTIMQTDLGTQTFQETYNLLPTGNVSLDIYPPEGTTGDCVQFEFENHIDPSQGGIAQIRLYECIDDTFLSFLQLCGADCPGNGTDSDGDGLDDDCEDCLGSDENDVDSDGDGMPDGYEFMWRHDPNVVDGLVDWDGDGLWHIDEYLGNSNPWIIDSPRTVVFVDENTTAPVHIGTKDNPYQTVNGAIQKINGFTPDKFPVTVKIEGGNYNLGVPPLVIPDDVMLIGRSGGNYNQTNYNATNYAILHGEVIAGDNTEFRRIAFQSDGSLETLLSVNDVTVDVFQCVFIDFNDSYIGNTGIAFSGETSAENSKILDTDFVGMDTGVDIAGGIPTITLNHFRGDSFHIVLQDRAGKGTTDMALSDITDPERPGLNKFEDDGGDQTVENNRPEEIKMELNDWGTNDLQEVDALIDGPADFEPILATGSSVLAGSLFVTVIDGLTSERVLDASIDLQVSPYDPITENEDGVYSYAALVAGTYTVTATAEGFDSVSDSVTVGQGDLVSLVLTFADEVPPEGCGRASMRAVYARGDMLVLVLAGAALLGIRFGRRFRKI